MSGSKEISTLVFALCSLISLSTPRACAETITGTVTNGTTSKPAAGDDVVLIKLAQGMEEAARTKTDARGKFSLALDDNGQPHLIRVIHQDVTYHHMVPPGATSVEMEVYDAAKKVEEVKAVADLMYLQAQGGQLGISRIFAVTNDSKPPRTQMNDKNFEFYLPEGAQIDSAQAQTAGGKWVDSPAAPQAEKGRYAFSFALRPGQTQFQVSYHLPYSGKATVDPQLIYPLDHFVVIMPQAIQFSPTQQGVYEEKQPPSPPGAIAEVAGKARPGQMLAFAISGNGVLQDNSSQDNSSSDDGQGAAPASGSGSDTRPGGGLGPPIDAPDPLQKYRWYILAGFAALLLVGAGYITTRSRGAAIPDFASNMETAEREAGAHATPRPGVLDALKDEMFQLEMEHKQGLINQEEYDKAKAALDHTLERALKRKTPA